MNLATCVLEVVEEVKNMEKEIKPFPSDKLEALALLYVQKSPNLKDLSPESLLSLYNLAYDSLRKADAEEKPNPMGYFQ